jgi:hypothetical protein
MFFTKPHKIKSNCVKSGDLGGQSLGPALLIHPPAICLSRWFLMWCQKCGRAQSCWRIVRGGNWGSAYSSSMFKNERPVTVFPKRKKVQLTCRALSQSTRSLLGCLCPTYMWHVDFDCPNPAVVPVCNAIDMDPRLVREAYLAEEIGWCVISF